ncbi:MAG: phosphoadenosine phosphosulfate reductase family protein [Chloroflexi bacterium]|nr:phosphoadenosine phosphosulfate reductase family protein [Chloroflexota bacterium]
MKSVSAPDAQERLRRAYGLVLQAAARAGEPAEEGSPGNALTRKRSRMPAEMEDIADEIRSLSRAGQPCRNRKGPRRTALNSTAARFNAISQRVMKPLAVDVFTAARERIRHVYNIYDQVVVSYSGGKDSTCILELAMQVARELGKLPVDVLFFDEEVLLPETEAMVMRTRARPEVDLKWVCGQVGYWDASSNENPTGRPGTRPSGTSGCGSRHPLPSGWGR